MTTQPFTSLLGSCAIAILRPRVLRENSHFPLFIVSIKQSIKHICQTAFPSSRSQMRTATVATVTYLPREAPASCIRIHLTRCHGATPPPCDLFSTAAAPSASGRGATRPPATGSIRSRRAEWTRQWRAASFPVCIHASQLALVELGLSSPSSLVELGMQSPSRWFASAYPSKHHDVSADPLHNRVRIPMRYLFKIA